MSDDRVFQMSLFRVFDIVSALRFDERNAAWHVRELLADTLGSSPTKADVVAYLRHRLKRRIGGAREDWYEVGEVEGPIAEFLSLWDDAGGRREPFTTGAGWAPWRWHVTPAKYRSR